MKRIVFDIDFDKEWNHLKGREAALRNATSHIFAIRRRDRKLYLACWLGIAVFVFLFMGSLFLIKPNGFSAFSALCVAFSFLGIAGFGGGVLYLSPDSYSKKEILEDEKSIENELTHLLTCEFSEIVSNMEHVKKTFKTYWYDEDISSFLIVLERLSILYSASQTNAFQCTPDNTDVNSWTNVQIRCAENDGFVSTLETRCKYQESITTEDAYFTYIDHVPTLVGVCRV